MQAHHLIPEEVWGRHQAFFNKIGLEGKRDAKENGLLMPDSEAKAKAMKRKFYHCGSHGVYSAIVEARVDNIEKNLIKKISVRQRREIRSRSYRAKTGFF
ncbi:AHH domain-containing protein [Burkholderia paludis]|uniref:AHH domain-containing protein n=1 Tax=Burkholderia TaxID=32008 RepID=UPI001269F2D7